MRFTTLFTSLFALVLPVASVAAQSPATVRIVHGIDGRDLGAVQSLPVDVTVDGQVLLAGFEFGAVAGPLSLPVGSYDIAISLADDQDPGSNPAVISASVPFAAGENVTVIAHLDADGNPTASKFVNDVSATATQDSRVILQHTAWAPEVDIEVGRRSVVRFGTSLLEDVPNGAQASLDVFLGVYDASVLVANTSTEVLGPIKVKAMPRRITSYFVVGSATNGTLSVIAVPID